MMTTKVFDLRAKRTEANAPRSLFGTVVEIKDPQTAYEADLFEPGSSPQKLDKLARFQSCNANDVLKAVEQDLKKQEHKVRFQKGKIKDLEHNALHFEPNQETIQSHLSESTSARVPKSVNKLECWSQKDNNGHSTYSIKKPGEYNYERYQKKKNNAKYMNTGNVLGVGGLFTHRENKYAVSSNKTPPQIGHKLSPVKSQKKLCLDFQIPANIKHIHGARLCNELMKDEDRVKKVLHLIPLDKMKPIPEKSVMIEHNIDPMYGALGNALRADVFNGVSYGHMKSLNTASYTEDVPKKSTEAFPPTFGKQKNADSKWNEDNVIRQRMKKQWDEVIGSKGKQDK